MAAASFTVRPDGDLVRSSTLPLGEQVDQAKLYKIAMV